MSHFAVHVLCFVLGHSTSATVRKINAHRDQLHLTINDVGLLSAFKSVERTHSRSRPNHEGPRIGD
jgi:hypothetical protein